MSKTSQEACSKVLVSIAKTAFYISRRGAFPGKFLSKKVSKKAIGQKIFEFFFQIFVEVVKKAFNTTRGTINGRKVFCENFFFCIVFGLRGCNFIFLAKTLGKLSTQVAKNHQRQIFCWTRTQEKNANWPTVFRKFEQKVSRDFENWNLHVQRSIFKYSKLFLRGQRNILGEVSIWRRFCLHSKILETLIKKVPTFGQNFWAVFAISNIHEQKNFPRKLFPKLFLKKLEIDREKFGLFVKIFVSFVKTHSILPEELFTQKNSREIFDL